MIVFTAPTGGIGHQVLEKVVDSGRPIRVIARDPSKLPEQISKRVEIVPGSHGDISVVNKAFAGIRKSNPKMRSAPSRRSASSSPIRSPLDRRG